MISSVRRAAASGRFAVACQFNSVESASRQTTLDCNTPASGKHDFAPLGGVGGNRTAQKSPATTGVSSHAGRETGRSSGGRCDVVDRDFGIAFFGFPNDDLIRRCTGAGQNLRTDFF